MKFVGNQCSYGVPEATIEEAHLDVVMLKQARFHDNEQKIFNLQNKLEKDDRCTCKTFLLVVLACNDLISLKFIASI